MRNTSLFVDRPVFRFFPLFVLVFIFCSFNSLGQSKNLNQQKQADSLFTQAQLALTMTGDIDKATRLFKKVVEIQPDNGEAWQQLGVIYSHNRQFSQAKKAMEAAYQSEPDNPEYMDGLATILAQTGDFIGAAGLYEKILDQEPNEPNTFLLKLAWVYNEGKEYRLALKTLNRLKNVPEEDKEQFLVDKLKLFAHLSGKDSVAATAEKLLQLNPDKAEYYTMAAFAEEQLQRDQQVVAIMKQAVETHPQDPVLLNQAIIVFTKYDHQQLIDFYDALVNSKDTTYSQKQKALLFHPLIDLQHQDSIAKELLYSRLPQLAFNPPANKDAIILWAAVHAANEKPKEAIAILRKGNQLLGNDVNIWSTLMMFVQEEGEEDSLKLYTSEALKAFPNHSFPYYYQAAINYDEGDTDGTLKNLKKAIVYGQKDSLINLPFLYSFIAGSFDGVGQSDSAEFYYLKALDLAPSSPMLLNNYSYLLAEQNKQLDSALSMSGRALAAEPEESMYLDTYGWILYKKGRYDESKYFIEKAIRMRENPDPVLYEHLGDVEKARGNHRKAKKNWLKAIQYGGKENEINKKLKAL